MTEASLGMVRGALQAQLDGYATSLESDEELLSESDPRTRGRCKRRAAAEAAGKGCACPTAQKFGSAGKGKADGKAEEKEEEKAGGRKKFQRPEKAQEKAHEKAQEKEQEKEQEKGAEGAGGGAEQAAPMNFKARSCVVARRWEKDLLVVLVAVLDDCLRALRHGPSYRPLAHWLFKRDRDDWSLAHVYSTLHSQLQAAGFAEQERLRAGAHPDPDRPGPSGQGAPRPQAAGGAEAAEDAGEGVLVPTQAPAGLPTQRPEGQAGAGGAGAGAGAGAGSSSTAEHIEL
jgi:hypothetical protein